jgi:prolipoprotein diacylglyceryltransferase
MVLVLIFTARFFIEFVKEDQVGFEAGMKFNMGQLLSFPYIFIGIGCMVYGYVKTNRRVGAQGLE